MRLFQHYEYYQERKWRGSILLKFAPSIFFALSQMSLFAPSADDYLGDVIARRTTVPHPLSSLGTQWGRFTT